MSRNRRESVHPLRPSYANRVTSPPPVAAIAPFVDNEVEELQIIGNEPIKTIFYIREDQPLDMRTEGISECDRAFGSYPVGEPVFKTCGPSVLDMTKEDERSRGSRSSPGAGPDSIGHRLNPHPQVQQSRTYSPVFGQDNYSYTWSNDMGPDTSNFTVTRKVVTATHGDGSRAARPALTEESQQTLGHRTRGLIRRVFTKKTKDQFSGSRDVSIVTSSLAEDTAPISTADSLQAPDKPVRRGPTRKIPNLSGVIAMQPADKAKPFAMRAYGWWPPCLQSELRMSVDFLVQSEKKNSSRRTVTQGSSNAGAYFERERAGVARGVGREVPPGKPRHWWTVC